MPPFQSRPRRSSDPASRLIRRTYRCYNRGVPLTVSSKLAPLICTGLFLATSLTQSAAATAFPAPVSTVEIVSSVDATKQPALFYRPPDSSRKSSVPLLVALHTWSGDYQQTTSVPMAQWCVAHDWAFIHPNFRGPNWTPPACGSDAAVQDILDAVAYSQAHAGIDSQRIYLMGTSGGGHMALLMLGRHPEIWAGVSAWVPISDLRAWYYECQTRNRNYAQHLLQALGGAPHGSLGLESAYQHRSPIHYLRPGLGVPVDINAGIRDGHDGSVPISHSLIAFNRLVPQAAQIAETRILKFTGTAQVPPELATETEPDPAYDNRQPLFRREVEQVRLTIFDGAHEGIPSAGLSWLAQQRKTTKPPTPK